MADKDPIITRDFVRGVFEIRQEPDRRWQEVLIAMVMVVAVSEIRSSLLSLNFVLS